MNEAINAKVSLAVVMKKYGGEHCSPPLLFLPFFHRSISGIIEFIKCPVGLVYVKLRYYLKRCMHRKYRYS